MRSIKKLLAKKAIAVPLALFVLGASFSFYMLTHGATPNPGHPWTEIGNGTLQVANTQTQVRTFLFPDSDADVLTSSSTPTLLQQTITSNITLSASSNVSIFANAGTGPITVTLPSASGTNAGLVYVVKKIDASLINQVTIAAPSGQTIDGIANISLANRGESAVLQSDGTNWKITLRRNFDYDAFHTRGASSTNGTQWYTSIAMGSALATTSALAANKIYAMPLILTKITTIDEMGVTVGSSTTSGGMEVGIYNDKGNEFPGTLAVDVGNQSSATNGPKTYTTNLPVTLDAGLYWMVVDASSTPKLDQFPLVDIIPLLGYSTTTVTAIQEGWEATLTTGALPATFPVTASTTLSGTPFPAIFVHFAS